MNRSISPASDRLPSGKIRTDQSCRDEIADVLQRLSRAGFALRQRKRVEQQRGEIVVEAVGEPRAAAVLLRERNAP